MNSSKITLSLLSNLTIIRHIGWIRQIDIKAEVEKEAVAKLLDHHKRLRKCQQNELAKCSAVIKDILYAIHRISVEIL